MFWFGFSCFDGLVVVAFRWVWFCISGVIFGCGCSRFGGGLLVVWWVCGLVWWILLVVSFVGW